MLLFAIEQVVLPQKASRHYGFNSEHGFDPEHTAYLDLGSSISIMFGLGFINFNNGFLRDLESLVLEMTRLIAKNPPKDG